MSMQKLVAKSATSTRGRCLSLTIAAAASMVSLSCVASPDDRSDGAERSAQAIGAARIVGYYASWTRSSMPPASIPWTQLTHVAHAFVLPARGGGLSGVSGYVDRDLIETAHAHGVKVVASVGGWGANFDDNVGSA